jgi:hypothetical protein
MWRWRKLYLKYLQIKLSYKENFRRILKAQLNTFLFMNLILPFLLMKYISIYLRSRIVNVECILYWTILAPRRYSLWRLFEWQIKKKTTDCQYDQLYSLVNSKWNKTLKINTDFTVYKQYITLILDQSETAGVSLGFQK